MKTNSIQLTPDPDLVSEIGWFVSGDLAEVLALVLLLGEGDDEGVAVAVLLGHQLDPGLLLVDQLVAHAQDVLAALPDDHVRV